MSECFCPNCGYHITTTQNMRRELPGWVMENLHHLRRLELESAFANENVARLNSYLAELRKAGFTLESLGQTLGVTRERVRQRVNASFPVSDVPLAPSPPDPPPNPVLGPLAPRHPITTTAENHELHEMQSLATQLRGGCAADDPRRLASEQLAARLDGHVQRGVPLAHLARVLGVSYGAVRARFARRGYRTLSPNHHKYQGASIKESA